MRSVSLGWDCDPRAAGRYRPGIVEGGNAQMTDQTPVDPTPAAPPPAPDPAPPAAPTRRSAGIHHLDPARQRQPRPPVPARLASRSWQSSRRSAASSASSAASRVLFVGGARLSSAVGHAPRPRGARLCRAASSRSPWGAWTLKPWAWPLGVAVAIFGIVVAILQVVPRRLGRSSARSSASSSTARSSTTSTSRPSRPCSAGPRRPKPALPTSR